MVIKEGPRAANKLAFKRKAKLDVAKTKKLNEFLLQKRWQPVSAQKA